MLEQCSCHSDCLLFFIFIFYYSEMHSLQHKLGSAAGHAKQEKGMEFHQ